MPLREPEAISAADAPQRWLTGDFEILRLADIQIPLDRLQETTQHVLNNYDLVLKDGYEKYKAICLQYRAGSANPLYDDVMQEYGARFKDDAITMRGVLRDGHCNLINEVGAKYDYLFTEFNQHFEVVRGRLLTATPGLVMNYHTDGTAERRLHVPVFSNPSAVIEYEATGNLYHLAPGNAYMFNAAVMHRVLNFSDLERTHLVFIIRSPVDNWTRLRSTMTYVSGMVTTRILGPDDEEELMSIASSHAKIMGVPKDHSYAKNFDTNLKKYLNPLDMNRASFGAFHDGKLVSAIGMYLWPGFPNASYVNMVVRPGVSRMYNIKSNGLRECMVACQKFCEARGIYNQYNLLSLKQFKTQIDQWDSYVSETGDRYQRYTEALIPAGTIPKWDWQWTMMGRIIWPVDLIVRCIRLKDEYREENVELYRRLKIADVVGHEKES